MLLLLQHPPGDGNPATVGIAFGHTTLQLAQDLSGNGLQATGRLASTGRPAFRVPPPLRLQQLGYVRTKLCRKSLPCLRSRLTPPRTILAASFVSVGKVMFFSCVVVPSSRSGGAKDSEAAEVDRFRVGFLHGQLTGSAQEPILHWCRISREVRGRSLEEGTVKKGAIILKSRSLPGQGAGYRPL